MTDANAIVRKLVELTGREANALRLENESLALRHIAAIHTERWMILQAVAVNNRAALGLTDETIALLGGTQKAE